MSSAYDKLRYQIVPPVFLVFFTVITQFLVALGNPDLPLGSTGFFGKLFSLFGSIFAWKLVGFFYLWAFISLKIPSKTFLGPAAPHGYVPKYSANGTQYYLVTLLMFFIVVFWIDPELCTKIHDDFSSIVWVLN